MVSLLLFFTVFITSFAIILIILHATHPSFIEKEKATIKDEILNRNNTTPITYIDGSELFLYTFIFSCFILIIFYIILLSKYLKRQNI